MRSSLLVFLFIPVALGAQSTAARPQAPCSRPEHRQFDFWVGEWDVTTPDGRQAGTNRIRLVHGGCALHEEWSGTSGFSGASLNAFDASTGRWHQTWIGSDGVLLQLDGGLKDGTMELSGATVGAGGAETPPMERSTERGPGSNGLDPLGNPRTQASLDDTEQRLRDLEWALRRRDAVLAAVGFAAERFLGSSDWEASVREVLERLGQAAEVSRVDLFELCHDEAGELNAVPRYQWVATAAGPGSADGGGAEASAVPQSAMARWYSLLRSGQTIYGAVVTFPP